MNTINSYLSLSCHLPFSLSLSPYVEPPWEWGGAILVWSVFVENAQEMVMEIGSRHGMQHSDVVQEEAAQGYTTKVCARELERESTRLQE